MQPKAIEIVQGNRTKTTIVIDEASRVTTAEIRFVDLFGDTLVFGRGKARWNPIDHFDPEIGKEIALGRAMAKFGKKMAVFWQRQAVSPGEYRAQLKRERDIQEAGQVLIGLTVARESLENPKPEKPKFPNIPHDVHGAFCDPCPILIAEQGKKQSKEVISKSISNDETQIAGLDNNDALDLRSLIEKNRAELEANSEKEGVKGEAK